MSISQSVDSFEKEIKLLRQKALREEKASRYQKAVLFRLKILNLVKDKFGPRHTRTALAQSQLALLYHDQGLYDKAEVLYKRSLEITENTLGANHRISLVSLGNLASLYQSQRLYQKAEPLLKRSLEIRENTLGANHPDTSSSFNNLALLYHDQGLYDKAEVLYKRSLKIKEDIFGANSQQTIITLGNLGDLYWEKRLFSKAEPLLLRALKITKKTFGADHQNTGLALNNLARLYSSQGLHSKAEPLLLRALEITENIFGNDHRNTALALNNLARHYHTQGLYKKAKPLFERSINVTKKTYGNDHPNMGLALNNLALLYVQQGLYNKAETLYKRSINIYEKAWSTDHQSTALGLNNLASLYNKQGQYKKAEPLYKRSLEIFEKVLGDDHPDIAVTLGNLALLYVRQGLFNKAEPLFMKAKNIESTFIQKEAPFLIEQERIAFIRKSFTPFNFDLATRNQSASNIAIFHRLNKQGLLEELEKRQGLLLKLETQQRSIAKEINQEIKVLTQELSSVRIKDTQRLKLISKRETLERKLYRILPELKPRIVEIKDVAIMIPKKGLLIEYQRYISQDDLKEKYIALTLNNQGKVSTVDLGLALPIEEKIRKALEGTETAVSNQQQLWDEVSQLVISPLAKQLESSDQIFISPDGELNRVPFAALKNTDSNQFLVEEKRIRLLTTGRELLDLAKDSNISNQKPLVVANPSFDLNIATNETTSTTNQKRSGDLLSQTWELLPGTEKEGKAIAKITEAELLTKERATALAIQKTDAPKVFHVASHAYYLPDIRKGEHPLLRSGIVLAGANQPSKNKKDDGYLTALEVTKLNFNGTEMVVVSGCESGKGDIQSGEGVYGLKRAIAVAGARSSLLSLWKVDDSATAAFMEGFYQKLKEGQERAEALSATQRDFREQRITSIDPLIDWSEPYYWAAFQLSGDWRPIEGL